MSYGDERGKKFVERLKATYAKMANMIMLEMITKENFEEMEAEIFDMTGDVMYFRKEQVKVDKENKEETRKIAKEHARKMMEASQ
jgi:hypothetical protein